MFVPKKFIAFAFAGCLIVACEAPEEEETPEWEQPSRTYSPDRSDAAKVVCEDAVGKMLKAPSTAEFDSTMPDRVDEDEQRYVWESHVDAQNSFGAQIRERFTCELECNTPSWCSNIKVEFE